MGIFTTDIAAMDEIKRWLIRDNLTEIEAEKVFNHPVGVHTFNQSSWKCEFTGWVFTINKTIVQIPRDEP
jgi:hypothetical protein